MLEASVSNLIVLYFVTEIENMQSDSSKGDNELQLMRKQWADEKMKKEQVRYLLELLQLCCSFVC